MSNKKVFIDPTIRIKYSSFYIQGLYDVFGKKNVKFSRKYFKSLERKTESHSYDHYMPFVVKTKNNLERYIIDFRDKRSVKSSAYDWCDKYAKINFSKTKTDNSFHEKMVSIPPGFGIKIWGKYELIINCFKNFLKCNLSPLVSFKNHFLDYYSQYLRPRENDYTSAKNPNQNEPFIFMIGTLWRHKNCIEGTNLIRKNFIEICKSIDIKFEGGFLSSRDHPQFEEFEKHIFLERYPTGTYIEKTKKSLFVFNTPAVHDCHGWKLGEYLAMGKAIISTPLSNELPEGLVHGENIHFISNSKELKNSIMFLLSNSNYRIHLENGAKKYYSKYASPKSVIENLMNR